MKHRLLPLSLLLLCVTSLPAQELRKLPTDVVLVKGARPSASDTKTPLPEGGGVARDVYRNAYFDLTYPLPAGWIQKYQGPPPSQSASYVLAQLKPGPEFKGESKGTLLISAQDLFFALVPAANATELIEHVRDSLQADYKVERPPAEFRIANHAFTRLDYMSPLAQLHWFVLATEIRCHVVRFVFTSPDPAMLETLIEDMNRMKLSDEGDSPACVAHYAEGANVTYRVDPVMQVRRFNAVPVRLIIDKAGKVRHVHVISAFPEQAQSITDALVQWRFKPYVRDGQTVEVETGIMLNESAPPAKGVRPSPATTVAKD